jgi:RNA methyltransferase, TrmH family
MRFLEINSLQNPSVKDWVLLTEKSRERKSQGLFIAEGLNEIRLCLNAGYQITSLIYCPDFISTSDLFSNFESPEPAEVLIAVSKQVFQKLAYRKDVKNAIAIVKSRFTTFKDIPIASNPLFLVAESVEKPGNLGALLRSADASGATAVLVCDPTTDIYNPNVIRSSVGCVFTMPVVSGTVAEVQQFLLDRNVSVYTTFMEKAVSAWEADFTAATALVVGTENSGLSDSWRKPNFTNVNIPMFGKVDSLNVSVAAALLLYEAKRQRN